jgi:pimeloyl-ACP methyl ester carboxylesterase
MRLVLDHVQAVASLAPMFSAEELARFEGPVLVLAGGADIVFPGVPTIARAKQVIRNLDAILVPDANHIDLRFYQPPLLDRIREFLAQPT